MRHKALVSVLPLVLPWGCSCFSSAAPLLSIGIVLDLILFNFCAQLDSVIFLIMKTG